MTSELWATIITTVVVPVLLRVLVHYFPWLADAVTPGTANAVAGRPAPAAPEQGVYDIDAENAEDPDGRGRS
jgi:hypothetical protein